MKKTLIYGNKKTVSSIFALKTALFLTFYNFIKYSLQGTTQGNGLTGGVPPVRFSM